MISLLCSLLLTSIIKLSLSTDLILFGLLPSWWCTVFSSVQGVIFCFKSGSREHLKCVAYWGSSVPRHGVPSFIIWKAHPLLILHLCCKFHDGSLTLLNDTVLVSWHMFSSAVDTLEGWGATVLFLMVGVRTSPTSFCVLTYFGSVTIQLTIATRHGSLVERIYHGVCSFTGYVNVCRKSFLWKCYQESFCLVVSRFNELRELNRWDVVVLLKPALKFRKITNFKVIYIYDAFTMVIYVVSRYFTFHVFHTVYLLQHVPLGFAKNLDGEAVSGALYPLWWHSGGFHYVSI